MNKRIIALLAITLIATTSAYSMNNRTGGNKSNQQIITSKVLDDNRAFNAKVRKIKRLSQNKKYNQNLTAHCLGPITESQLLSLLNGTNIKFVYIWNDSNLTELSRHRLEEMVYGDHIPHKIDEEIFKRNADVEVNIYPGKFNPYEFSDRLVEFAKNGAEILEGIEDEIKEKIEDLPCFNFLFGEEEEGEEDDYSTEPTANSEEEE